MVCVLFRARRRKRNWIAPNNPTLDKEWEAAYKMTSLIQSGVDISPVITHHFPFQQFTEAIELAKSGNSGKIVMEWSER